MTARPGMVTYPSAERFRAAVAAAVREDAELLARLDDRSNEVTTETPEADWADDIERDESMSMDAANLFAAITSANVANLAAVTDSLIENLTARAETAEATLDAVRGRIGHLLGGDYMPTPAALEDALYPPDRVIDTYRKLENQ